MAAESEISDLVDIDIALVEAMRYFDARFGAAIHLRGPPALCFPGEIKVWLGPR